MANAQTIAAANVVDLQTYRRQQDKHMSGRCLSRVHVWLDADGRLQHQLHVWPEHSDRMVDALLLMLIKARQAS
ncbi:hypothetical protein PQR64_24015 [Paraburkholderia phytofirmans]|uniref:hypothetical protein n=1 Tax=Paraburkholderia phytofirmans TaxID=261302 RepID=UPI0038B6B8B8